MSFKREGDDHAWLNVLKKRRVSELFALNIPDDEALLVKNGRFACLVCRHRPVFDSVATLAVHRNGKKHAIDAEVFMMQKSELEELKMKRKHEQYINGGECTSNMSCSTSTITSTASNNGLLNACVYDPRVKRRNVGPYGRKQKVNLDEEARVEAATIHVQSLIEGQRIRPRHCVPPDDKPPQTIVEIRKHIRRQAELENPAPLKPYIGKRGSSANCNSTGFLHNPNSFLQSSERIVDKRLSGSEMNEGQSETAGKNSDTSEMSCSSFEPIAGNRTYEKTQKIAKYFTAVGSGWKRDRDGTWIKDPDAEFESDDEPPDTL